MNVLFVMAYPGYLRYFSSTVRQLALRGHTVRLAFDIMHKQSEGLEALASMPSDQVRVVGRVPKRPRSDRWRAISKGLRGTVDYVRYLDPYFANAPELRRRLVGYLPSHLQWLEHVPSLPSPLVRVLIKGLLAGELLIPSSRRLEAFLQEHQPDLLVLSPLVTVASKQTDLLKSARALGVPVAVCIASWDHLTTKGLIRLEPDAVMVWNATQKAEATRLHGMHPRKVEVTGAPSFDEWFGRSPSLGRAAFCAKVGLPTDTRFILFVGSTASISPPAAEVQFVRRWIQVLRASPNQAMREISVLIRPHPYNSQHWSGADLSGLGTVSIWPRHGANPVDERDRADYFDSLYHSEVVVGVNTSAMIEAAIVGRPVMTVQDPEFAGTQTGTLHFHYMLPDRGGFLLAASTLNEHQAQLVNVLDGNWSREQSDRFVHHFVRPYGLDLPATPRVVDAIERVGRMTTSSITSRRVAAASPS